MKLKIPVSISILLILAGSLKDANAQSYAVEKAAFNSDRYDDYSPVRYRDGMVFCSNRKYDIMVVYDSPDNTGNARMWFVPINDTTAERDPRMFSKVLLTPLTF